MAGKSIRQRLADQDGAAWLRAALKTVNAPLPIETTSEDMLACVLGDRNDLYAAVRIFALIDEVPAQTLANVVARKVLSYQELVTAMERISSFGLNAIETETGQWIIEMAGLERLSDSKL